MAAAALSDALPLPLDQLVNTRTVGKAHSSNEYTGWAKFDPRDFETSAAKSVGNYTTEKVDLIGADVTILTAFEYDPGYLRVFGTLQKKFKWHPEETSSVHSQIVKSDSVVLMDGKKKVYITQAD